MAGPVHEPPSPLPREIFDWGKSPGLSAASQAGDLTAPEANTLPNRTCNAHIIQQLVIFKGTLNISFQERAASRSYTRTSVHSEDPDTVGGRLGGLEGPVSANSNQLGGGFRCL